MSALSPDEYAASWQMALRIVDGQRDRTQQTERGQVGISDIGLCKEKARRTILGVQPSSVTVNSAAMVGTALHEWALPARKQVFPSLLIEQEVSVTLPNGCVVPGHADEIDPEEPSVTDLKTTNGLEYVKENGSSEQQRMQRGLYYAAAHQAGLVPADGVTRNVWWDRSGTTPEVYVEQEPYDPAVLQQASDWLDDVLYAVRNGEEAERSKEINFCERFCEHFADCRPGLLTPEAVTRDPELIEAAETLLTARAEIKRWEEIEKEAKARTLGFSGQAGEVLVRQEHVNGARSYVKQHVRRAS